MHRSFLESRAWLGEKIRVWRVGGKGQINRAYQAVPGLCCLASEFRLYLGSSQDPIERCSAKR